MSTKQVSGGAPRAITYTNGGAAISAGDVVICGVVDAKKCQVGVALVDIAATTGTGAVAVSGLWQFPKVSAAVIKAGEAVNWDASAAAVDDNAHTTGAGDVAQFGVADEDAGNGVTTINVWIDQPGTYDAA